MNEEARGRTDYSAGGHSIAVPLVAGAALRDYEAQGGGPENVHETDGGYQSEFRAAIGVYALSALIATKAFLFFWRGGTVQIDSVIGALAKDPARLIDNLPLLILAWLLYVFHRDNGKILRDLNRSINENTKAIYRVMEEREGKPTRKH